MKISRITIFALASLLITLGSCKKNEGDIQGCTDPLALNYNPRATIENDTCRYEDKQYTIWNEGDGGTWGDDVYIEKVFAEACQGQVDTISYITSVDTIYLDTTGMGQDTLEYNMATVLYLMRDPGTGQAKLNLYVNNQIPNAQEFKYGSVSFDVSLANNSPLTTFDVRMMGSLWTGSNSCQGRLLSDVVNVAATDLTDSTYTNIRIPVAEFANRRFVDIEHLFGVDVINTDPGNDTLLYITNIQYSTLSE